MVAVEFIGAEGLAESSHVGIDTTHTCLLMEKILTGGTKCERKAVRFAPDQFQKRAAKPTDQNFGFLLDTERRIKCFALC